MLKYFVIYIKEVNLRWFLKNKKLKAMRPKILLTYLLTY